MCAAQGLVEHVRAVVPDGSFASGFGGFLEASNDPLVYRYSLFNMYGGAMVSVGVYANGGVVLNGEPVSFSPGNSFVYELPPAVDLAFFFNGASYQDQRALAGVQCALRDVAASSLLRLPDGSPLLSLRVAVYDTTRGDASVYARAVRLFSSQAYFLGVLGGIESNETAAILRAAAPVAVPVLSPASTAMALSAQPWGAYFQRLVEPDAQQATRLAELCYRLGWTLVSIVYDETDLYAVGLLSGFQAAAASNRVSVCPQQAVKASGGGAALRAAAAACASHVFVLLANAPAACALLASSAASGLSGDGYTWVGVDGWLSVELSCGSQTAVARVASVGALGTAPAEGSSALLLPALAAAMSVNVSSGADLAASDASAIASANAWRASWVASNASLSPTWIDGAVYDAVWVYAHALAAMIADRQVLQGRECANYLNRVSFSGVRGPVDFLVGSGAQAAVHDGPVVGVYDILNIVGPAAVAVLGNQSGRGLMTFTGCLPGATRRPSGVCAPCTPDEFKSVVGDGACTPCPTNGVLSMTTNGSTGVVGVAGCLCPAGLYFSPAVAAPFKCLQCPIGALCNSVQTMPADMLNAPGFWRGNPNSTSFDRCFDASRCPLSGPTVRVVGGRYTTPCAAGYAGPLCGGCGMGFGKDVTKSCVACMSSGVNYAIAGVGVGVTAGVVAFLVGSRLVHDTFRLNRKRAANNIKVLINFFQINSFLQYFRVEWNDAMRSVFEAQDTAGASGLAIVGWDCLVQSNSAFLVAFAAYMSVPALFLFLSPLTIAGAKLFSVVNPKYKFKEDTGVNALRVGDVACTVAHTSVRSPRILCRCTCNNVYDTAVPDVPSTGVYAFVSAVVHTVSVTATFVTRCTGRSPCWIVFLLRQLGKGCSGMTCSCRATPVRKARSHLRTSIVSTSTTVQVSMRHTGLQPSRFSSSTAWESRL